MQHKTLESIQVQKTKKLRIHLLLSFTGMFLFLILNFASSAQMQSFFADNFEDGNVSDWSRSGGSWSVVTNGSKVYRQSGTSADARARAGSDSWTNYSVEARVRVSAFNGSNRYVAVLSRIQSYSNYYYLALSNNNTLELKKMVSGSPKTLSSKSFSVSTNTWYTLKFEVSGTSLKGYVNGTLQLTANDSDFNSGKIGAATNYASADFDDFVVSTLTISNSTPTPTITPTSTPTATPTPNITPTPTPTITPTPTPTVTPTPTTQGPVGFAAVNSLGQNGTTGGTGGTTVTVTTASQFLDYIGRTGRYVIKVNGLLVLPSGMHNIKSDKTIIGVSNYSGISGAGLQVTSAQKNIIVRNLLFTSAPDDSFNVQGAAHHIWVDHCTFTNGYDGLLDIKHGSDFVTVSWNRFYGHDKTSLVGHSDSNGSVDKGHLRVTYHHNWFDGTEQRHPRVRFADPVHVFNNYYSGNEGYGVASTMNAGVLVEGNYFEGVRNPTVTVTGDSDPGRLVQRNNYFVNSGLPQSAGSVVEPRTYYSYTLDPAQNVKQIVTQGAGVGNAEFLN
jgi:pectate lyase